MNTVAVVLREPEDLALATVTLAPPGAADVVVDVEWSGISTGTERLLWSGSMPMFPGMGYPLVPGYETVGRVRDAGPDSGRHAGERVFVPGSKGFLDVRGLFGGAARRVVLPGARATPISESLGDSGVLLALAATAQHAIAPSMPDLIVGHGVLGRLIARLVMAHGAAPPMVWETNPERAQGATGYTVVDPAQDARRDYRCICDVSGSTDALDTQIASLAPGGEIILAGFYSAPLSFAFPPAFMREARIRVAAEWKPADLVTVTALLDRGVLSLDGLITHRAPASDAAGAYRTAFENPACLKMILDWRDMP